ncbi:MAG: hypothetical protein IT269_04090 [Saprospiraceae bacterium]|nr:hypothetical protein [Saprospiraceae bacterium]
MKNLVFSLVSIFAFAGLFTSCDKTKELNFDEKLPGSWQSVKVTQAGNTQTGSSYLIHLESSKEFDMDITTNLPIVGKTVTSRSGTWTSDIAKQEIQLTYDDSGEQITWDVTQLTDTQMNIELIQNGVRYNIQFEKK